MRAVLTLIAAIACSPQETPRVPFTSVELSIGALPSSVAALEVTGDGHADVLVTAAGHVIVFEGDGRGGFEPGNRVPAGENPVAIAGADFDGDGLADLAIANHETDYLTLLLATGGGGFEPAPWSPLRIEVGPHPHAVVAADVDEDGHADLVFDDRDRESLAILAGSGDGRFTPLGSIDVGGDPYRGMRLADLDDDGHVDAIAPIERAVAVRWGDGSGAFADGATLETGGLHPFAVEALDWNGDGILDLAAGSGEGETGVAILLGDGDGGFRGAPGSPYDGGPGPKALAAADLDGDGAEDLLVTAWDAPVLTVLFGGEAGARTQRVEVGTNPFGVDAGDLNGDGRPDVVVANQGSDNVTILLSDPEDGEPTRGG